MLLYLVSRIISASGAFLYPTYASYKTLCRRPASEADLERWLMYWSVLGSLLAIEYTAEWTVSWLPFYYPIKTLFLLYLALPQTRGASYIYTTALRPRLAAHEADIDAALLRAREAGFKWAQRQARALWENFSGISEADHQGIEGPSGVLEVEGVRRAASSPSPTLADPASGPAGILSGIWSYAPALAALLAPPAPRQARSKSPPSPTSPSPPTVATAPVSAHSSAIEDSHSRTLLARRRALEAELASLPLLNSPEGIPRVASSTYLPAQGDDPGRYEEIARDEVDGRGSGEDGDENGVPVQRRSSWWWGRSDGYERAKTE